jgi:serine/threonine-protein kinase
MAKDPADRYATADAFLAAFRAAVDEEHGRRAPHLDDGAGLERRAIGLHLEVLSSADDPDNPDAHMLADMETVAPLAIEILCARGLGIVLQTGNTALFMAELPVDPERADPRRREVITAALDLHRALARRPDRDARVHVNICLHEGTVEIDGAAVIGGDLLALASWVAQTATPGVMGTPSTFAGLGLETEPAGSSPDLVRVLDAADPPLI